MARVFTDEELRGFFEPFQLPGGLFQYVDNVALSGTSVVAAAPEPGTLALLGLGIAGLAVRRRKGN